MASPVLWLNKMAYRDGLRIRRRRRPDQAHLGSTEPEAPTLDDGLTRACSAGCHAACRDQCRHGR
jgi:hypothetical protein